jgi:hypothetical protein
LLKPTAATYNYQVNAVYVINALTELGITATLNEVQKEETTVFEVQVDEHNLAKAITAIETMQVDDSVADADSEGYLKDHEEWSDRMYDPGYYTGGRIPHFYLDKQNWKFFAPYFLFGGLVSGYAIFKEQSIISIEFLMWTVLYVFVGASMYRQLKKK